MAEDRESSSGFTWFLAGAVCGAVVPLADAQAPKAQAVLLADVVLGEPAAGVVPRLRSEAG